MPVYCAPSYDPLNSIKCSFSECAWAVVLLFCNNYIQIESISLSGYSS